MSDIAGPSPPLLVHYARVDVYVYVGQLVDARAQLLLKSPSKSINVAPDLAIQESEPMSNHTASNSRIKRSEKVIRRTAPSTDTTRSGSPLIHNLLSVVVIGRNDDLYMISRSRG
jgi:hypothetical protein